MVCFTVYKKILNSSSTHDDDGSDIMINSNLFCWEHMMIGLLLFLVREPEFKSSESKIKIKFRLNLLKAFNIL